MMTTTVFWTNPEEGYLPQLLTDRIAGNAGRYHRKTDRVAASRSQFHSFLWSILARIPTRRRWTLTRPPPI